MGLICSFALVGIRSDWNKSNQERRALGALLGLKYVQKVIGDKFLPSQIIYALPLGLDIIISGLLYSTR